MNGETSSGRPTGGRAVPASALAALAAVLLAACGSGAPEPPAQLLDSRVRDPAVSVDGLRQDWEGNLTRVGDRNVFAGFHRRGDALYMAIVSQDPGFDARVFRSGLTVWFDTAAARSRVRGIRFPFFGPEARKRLGADTTSGRPDRERILRAAGPDFVLVTDGSGESRLSPGEAEGLELAASVERGLFTWELRIPLGAGDGPGHALPVSPGDTISVGLQAGGDQGALAGAPAGSTVDSATADSAAADTAPADVDSSGEERRPSPRPGVFPGPGREVPELEIWVRVNLSIRVNGRNDR